MESPLHFEEVEEGQRWVSPSRTVTEADVVSFATSTGDFNPLHVDHEFASKSHYRQPVAHGLLGVAWVAGLGSYFPWMNTIAFTGMREWEFLKPLFIGDTVYVETVCQSKELTGRRAGKIVWLRSLINQRGQIVQQGIFETLVALKTPVSRPHFEQTTRHSEPVDSAHRKV